MTMNLYKFISLTCGSDESMCIIAAQNHEEALDILIEYNVRTYFGIDSGILSRDAVLSEPDCCGLHDHLGGPATRIMVHEVRVPVRPGPTWSMSRRILAIDVEASLLRRGSLQRIGLSAAPAPS
jgi:hypothetical protein